MRPSAEEIARFAGLLGTERDIYAEILDMAGRQAALLKAGDSTGLLEIIGAKQELVGRLTELAGELAPLKDGWKSSRDSIDAAERAKIEAVLSDIAGLLEKIIAEENSTEEIIGSKREESVERIKKLQTGKKMLKAYGDGKSPAPRFTDGKS